MNYQELIEEVKYLESIKEELVRELNKYTHINDKLYVRKNHDSYQYYINNKYVKRGDEKNIHKVACKEYYDSILKLVKERENGLKTLIKKLQATDLKNFYANLNQGRRKLLEERIIPDYKSPLIDDDTAIRIWSQIEYEHWKVEEDCGFETNRGEYVRSKSEKIIADELYMQGIPYKYECPLVLKVGGQDKLFRPDFTCFNARQRKVVILEHMGMMDDMEYVDRCIEKINIYAKNGYINGDKLIMTQETLKHPLDIKVLRMKIELFLK